ncbi:MAG: phosphoenolpyruvate carboxylase, partial [Bacteroidetes bacterium]|nr:phosphoenolpyruvate carboxylase [Bacteroidota bacterium]
YQAEQKLTSIGNKSGVKLCFFHGRGGTISRGGGKIHRFLESMPPGSVSGQIKMTVQGETIANQFANLINATYNLEVFISSSARQAMISRLQAEPEDPEALPEIMDSLVSISRQNYRKLLDHPGFIEFYNYATPIEVLEQSKIGSRPARRTGKRSLTDLRSIPWVFSWSQSRFNLPGWFGTGAALKQLTEEIPDSLEKLQKAAIHWPFMKFQLIQIETNLLNADPAVMKSFAELVPNESIREEFMAMILGDYEECLREIEQIMVEPTAIRRIAQLENVKLRGGGLNILHQMQINYINQWRALKETSPEEAGRLLPKLLLLVNAISGGLKKTG